MSVTALPQSEKQFQAAVIEYAKLNGWLVYHTRNSRGSEPGFPDLVLVHPGSGDSVPRRPRLVFAELKTERGRTSLAQAEWLSALGRVTASGGGSPMQSPRIFTELWRPRDWWTIERKLARTEQVLR